MEPGQRWEVSDSYPRGGQVASQPVVVWATDGRMGEDANSERRVVAVVVIVRGSCIVDNVSLLVSLQRGYDLYRLLWRISKHCCMFSIVCWLADVLMEVDVYE